MQRSLAAPACTELVRKAYPYDLVLLEHYASAHTSAARKTSSDFSRPRESLTVSRICQASLETALAKFKHETGEHLPDLVPTVGALRPA